MATALIGIGAAAAVSHFALQRAKQNLARQVAESASEFLDLDPDRIQSALLSPNARLVLNDVGIKAIDLTESSPIRLEGGVVDEIEFTWKWGGSKDGTTAYVRDAQLTVSGARILLVVVGKNDDDARGGHQTASSNEQKAFSEDEKGDDETIGRHMQQILDHLTVRIMDLHVDVQVDTEDEASSGGDSYGVALEAEALKLISLGRETSNHGTAKRSDTGEPWEEGEEPLPPPLLQKISIERVCAYLFDKKASPDEGRKYLVEPFGYTADVKRVQGQRFSGFDFGLDIVGRMIPIPGQEHVDPIVTIHAGKSQIQTLLRIFNTTSTGLDDEATLEMPTEQVTPYSTSFVLHLPSVVLVLPNGATIQTFFWCLCQRADGSVNNLEAKGAVTVNATHAFVLLEEGKCFRADFTENKISLQATTAEAESPSQVHDLAKVTWQETEMARVLEGVDQVARLVDPDYGAEKEENAAVVPSPQAIQEPRPWSFETEGGIISFRVESRTSEGTKWAEASLDSPVVILPDRPNELPKEVSFSGATLGPTSFGDMTIRMESMKLKTDAFKRATIGDMQSFIIRALGMSSSS